MARTLERRVVPVLVGLIAPALLACSSPASEGEEGFETGDPASESGAETGLETETGTEETTGDGDGDGEPPRPDRLVVTADWRAKRLSLLDYAVLRELDSLGSDGREAALWKTIELPEHEPGPLEVELTPDGSLALVAISPGFFAGAAGALIGLAPGDVPEGGALLIVEVDSGTVLAEFDTAQAPMGIAIAPDGTRAWTANFGGNGETGTTLSVIDLVDLTISEELQVGPGPEQLDLSADGSLAIINTASDGAIRLFETADPGPTLSPALQVSDDPSWVLLLEDGMDRAVAINSLGPPGYSLLDVSDPAAPALLDTISVSGVPYAAQPGAASDEILLSIYAGTSTSLQIFDVDTGEVVDQIDADVAGFPLGIVFEPSDELALVPVPGANALIVADFGTGEHRVLDWQDQPGPTYVSMD